MPNAPGYGPGTASGVRKPAADDGSKEQVRMLWRRRQQRTSSKACIYVSETFSHFHTILQQCYRNTNCAMNKVFLSASKCWFYGIWIYCYILGGWGISIDGGFDKLGRIPGVELGPGVESPLGVGVLDFSPGVPALSRCCAEGQHIYALYNWRCCWVGHHHCHRPTIAISLDLREEELADDAVDAGLEGSFLAWRALSKPFSLGEGRGVPRGEAGSWWGGRDSIN